ncbi:hypothetical protein [Streptomyces coerulescens]
MVVTRVSYRLPAVIAGREAVVNAGGQQVKPQAEQTEPAGSGEEVAPGTDDALILPSLAPTAASGHRSWSAALRWSLRVERSW